MLLIFKCLKNNKMPALQLWKDEGSHTQEFFFPFNE